MRNKKFKLLWIIPLIFFMLPVISVFADINKELTFTWEQATDELQYLKEWRLYMSDTSGGPYVPAVDTSGNPIVIGYDPADTGGAYTSTQIMVIPGAAGSTVQKYFVMTAVDKDDLETDYSNQAIDETTGNDYITIKIPMGKPFSVKVKVKAGNVP